MNILLFVISKINITFVLTLIKEIYKTLWHVSKTIDTVTTVETFFPTQHLEIFHNLN